MKKQLLTVLCMTFALLSHAQPKWIKNTQKSLLTLYALQTNGDTLSSKAFFANEKGSVFSVLQPIRNATKAWVTDQRGKTFPVTLISGFNTTYNVVRLKVETGNKNTPSLSIGLIPPTQDVNVYLVPLGTKDRITQIERAAEWNYYTLESKVNSDIAGSPLLNETGDVVGIVQNPITIPNAPNYALDIRLALALKNTVMDANNADLRLCAIPKELPEEEKQAKSFLYLVQGDKHMRMSYANNFITAFPKSPFGYIYKAELEAEYTEHINAQETYRNGLASTLDHADEILFSRAQTIYQNTIEGKKLPELWTLDEALKDVQNAYSLNNLPLYTLLEAKLLFAKQNYENAYTKFISLTQTNLRTPDLFLYAAQCKENMNVPKEEILALNDSAVSCFSRPYTYDAANYLWYRSQTLKDLGRYRDAIADLNDYEHLMNGRLTDVFYFEREQMEQKTRMYAQALNDIQKSIELNPSERLYYAEQAVLHYRTNQLDEAITSCEKAIQLDDQFADAYRIYGVCLLQKGDKEGARAQLKKAIELGDEMAQGVIDRMQ